MALRKERSLAANQGGTASFQQPVLGKLLRMGFFHAENMQ
jgi:hypothetical protein